MNFYYIQQGISSIAIGAVLAGAVISCSRACKPATILQAIGAAMLVISIVMSHLVPMSADPKTFKLEPVWIWRFEQVLSCLGLAIFAVGYIVESVQKPRQGSGDAVSGV